MQSGEITFEPERLAHLEVEGWRAYYDHKWLRCLHLMVQLAHEQFGLSWAHAVQAAYFIIRASIAWAPKDNDRRATRLYIRRFYRVAVRHGKGVTFDPARVGALEYNYWDVHRQLAGRPDDEKEPLVNSLVALHNAIFHITPEQARQSAVSRAHAADTVDLITRKRSADIEGDWRKCEQYLREAYRNIVSVQG